MTPLEDAMNDAKAFPSSVGATQINNILNVFIWFERCPKEADVLAGATKLMELKRFRSVAEGGAWLEHEEADAKEHVELHKAASEAAALKLLQNFAMSKELPRDRPLWSIDVVEVTEAGARSMGLLRVHHTIGDGIGLASEMLPLLATNLDGSAVEAAIPQLPKKTGGLSASLLRSLDSVRSFGRVLAASAGAMETDLPFLDPQRKQGLSYSGRRALVLFPALSLSYVKRVKEAAKCTVNDVIFSAWAGAMRRYSEAHGFDFETQQATARALLAVAVPRSFPDSHDPEDRLINHFAFCPVQLALKPASPQERLKANKANLDVVKRTTLAPVSLWVTERLQPLLPRALQQLTARDVFSRHSLVFSNVPGPRQEIRVFGQRVESFHCAFYNVNTQLLAISYGERIFLNVTADPEVAKGMESQFPKFMIEELEDLGRSFGVEGSCLA